MKYFALIVFLLMFACPSLSQTSGHSTKQPISKKDIKYIPKDLDECIKQIDKFWDDTMKAKAIALTEKEFGGQYHFGLGLWIRNNWGLWRGSRLSRYFNRLGVYHPDGMSGIILASYYRYLKGLDINLNDQIKQCHRNWKVAQEPSKKDYPAEAPDLEFSSGLYYDTKDSGLGLVRVGTSRNTDATWLYDYYLGWLKVSDSQLHSLDSLQTREAKLRELYSSKK